MERRELYEPEDIEQLLLERPYDELLEEERAFVLRHLTGRDEYEAMRTLLLSMHDEDASTPVLDADPAVREHVLGVFRAQQKPHWQIWLNSVHAFLLPKEASAFWRPALALGSVAIVVFFVVNGTRRLQEAAVPQVAQLNEEKPQSAVAAPDAPAAQLEPQLEAPLATVQFEDAQAADAEEAPVLDYRPAEQEGVRAELKENELAAAMEPPPAAGSEDLADMPAAEGEVSRAGKMVQGVIVMDAEAVADSFQATAPPVTHQVTPQEFTMNMTTAGTSVESISTKSAQRFLEKDKAKEERAKKRGLFDGSRDDLAAVSADVTPLLDLLRAAW